MSKEHEGMSFMGDRESLPLEVRFGSVTHTFTHYQVPSGDVPEPVRDQWLGVSLPVREDQQAGSFEYIDELSGAHLYQPRPIKVLIEDAVVALIDHGRQPAADFWGSRFAPDDILVFSAYDGDLDVIV